jgi:hypothetical protein
MKMLVAKERDEIVGFTAFGIEASELMASVQTAMIGRLPYTALRDALFAHPTMSEGLVYLLGQVESTKVRRKCLFKGYRVQDGGAFVDAGTTLRSDRMSISDESHPFRTCVWRIADSCRKSVTRHTQLII